MRVFFAFCIFFTAFISGFCGVPPMENLYITDIAGIINEPDRELISEMLRAFEKKTGIHTAVLTVNSISDYGSYLWISDFASDVFDTWGVGNRKYDNGILLVVAVKDRTVNFHMGSAFRGAFSRDLREITEKYMLAFFSVGEVSRGIYEGLRELVRRISSRSAAPDIRKFLPFVLAALLLIMSAFTIRYLRDLIKNKGRLKHADENSLSSKDASEFGRAGIAGF